MKIVICEEDKKGCQEIEKWIKEYGIEESIDIAIDIFYSAESLLEKMSAGYYFDMIYLNIIPPQKKGIDLGRIINKRFGERTVSIVFISDENSCCEVLFELEPQNFHLKPLRKEMIQRDIDKCVTRCKKNKAILKYIEDGITKGIYLGDIVCVEAERNGTIIHTKEGRQVHIKESVTSIAERFEKYYFFRCHKSFVVNAKYIKKFVNQKFYLLNGYEIGIGRKYLDRVKKSWKVYELEKFY